FRQQGFLAQVAIERPYADAGGSGRRDGAAVHQDQFFDPRRAAVRTGQATTRGHCSHERATNEAVGAGNQDFQVGISVSSAGLDDDRTHCVGGNARRAAFELQRRLVPQGEVEAGSRAALGFGPDPPAVTTDDALDGGQADAGAVELVRTVQAAEYLAQVVSHAHVEAGSILGLTIDRHAFDQLPVEIDTPLLAPRPKLPGVAYQNLINGP